MSEAGEQSFVADHPRKLRIAEFPAAAGLRADEGWVRMDVKFLVTRETVGSEETVFGITVFPPGSRHEVHRHPNAEEVEYLVEGSGVARIGDADVLMQPGEVVFVRKDEYHGFVNTSSSTNAVLVWSYGGAASLEEAGYVTLEADAEKGP